MPPWTVFSKAGLCRIHVPVTVGGRVITTWRVWFVPVFFYVGPACSCHHIAVDKQLPNVLCQGFFIDVTCMNRPIGRGYLHCSSNDNFFLIVIREGNLADTRALEIVGCYGFVVFSASDVYSIAWFYSFKCMLYGFPRVVKITRPCVIPRCRYIIILDDFTHRHCPDHRDSRITASITDVVGHCVTSHNIGVHRAHTRNDQRSIKSIDRRCPLVNVHTLRLNRLGRTSHESDHWCRRIYHLHHPIHFNRLVPWWITYRVCYRVISELIGIYSTRYLYLAAQIAVHIVCRTRAYIRVIWPMLNGHVDISQ